MSGREDKYSPAALCGRVRLVNGADTGNMLFNGKEFMEFIYPDSGPPQELVFMKFCDEHGKRINVGIDADGLTIKEVEPENENTPSPADTDESITNTINENDMGRNSITASLFIDETFKGFKPISPKQMMEIIQPNAKTRQCVGLHVIDQNGRRVELSFFEDRIEIVDR